MNSERYITAGELVAQLSSVPPDTPIMFNVQRYENDPDDNWDTFNAQLSVDSFICPGYTGCTHTEPEIDCEVVIFIKQRETNEH